MSKQFTIGLLAMASIMLFQSQTVKAAETIPVTFSFSSDLEGCTIINPNPSSVEFEWNRWDKLKYDGGYGDTADDWVVTPALSLDAGKIYELSYTASAYWNRIEWNPTVTWMIGFAPNAEDLNAEIQPSLSLESNYNDFTKTFSFSVQTSGEYYIGMHLQADELDGAAEFCLKEIDIKEGLAPTIPSAPELTAKPFIEDGILKVSLTLTAPSSTLGGDELSGEMTYTIVASGDRQVATGTVEAGAEIAIIDTECNSAYETYTATVTNTGGTSKGTEVYVSIKYDTPAAPANVKVEVAGDLATISWDAVTEGKNGGLFNPATVVYSVQRADRTYVVTKTSECSVTDQLSIPDEGQMGVAYTVQAYSNPDAYSSSDTKSEPVVIGNPYTGSFAESFAGGKTATTLWNFVPDTEAHAWKPVTSCYSNPSCEEGQDSDGGFLQYTTASYYRDRNYLSPVIDMSGAQNPVIEFYIYRYSSSPQDPMVNVSLLYGEKEVELTGGQLSFKAESESDGWQLVRLAIPSEVEGAFRIHFEGLTPVTSMCYALIDNLKVRDLPAKNITIDALTAPKSALPGDTSVVEATISNTGADALTGVEVVLSYDGVTLESQPLELASGEKKVVPFNVYVSPFMTDSDVKFEATVNVAGDKNPDDNSAETEMKVGAHYLPTASSLSASHSDQGVNISWMNPEISDTPTTENVNESFEDRTVGDMSAGDGWIYLDVDGGDRAGLAGVNSGKKYAFFVTDKFTSSDSSVEAEDGEKALVATRNSDWSDVDVWLISPEIDPSVPVSFYAAGIGGSGFGDANIEVGYLVGNSTDVADFVKKEEVNLDRRMEWEKIELNLPADATRFAIHVTYINNNGVAFDDFSFGALTAAPELMGHKIWRNNSLIATLAPEAVSHLDTEADRTQTNTYHISSLYAPSREVLAPENFVLDSGLATGIEETDSDNSFVISGNTLTVFADCEVYTLQGQRKATLKAGCTIVLESGVYMIVGSVDPIKVII